MTVGKIYSGFELISIKEAKDIAGAVHFFRHVKTGAELIWTGRKDTNKTFAIAFKTIPEDDTGVFHILEHSVLCGSEKYPVKEPFVELLKGSLNTFLNAMTFPDKTVYPVASRNDADFRNLMRIYLDAVFRPAIYGNENIFLQEGWHYETDENGVPRYVGVVFGEMTGAYSDVDNVIELELLRKLFPDTCYGYSSGGEPDHIPELTYEKFISAHKRFYHPSNSRIFLDGDMDVQDVLFEIDRDYLSVCERREPDFGIKLQKPLHFVESTVRYAITPGESDTGRAHFVMGRIIGDYSDPAKALAVSVLRDHLAGSNSAPLKRAVLEKGLGQDLRFDVEDGIAQSFVTLQVRNASEEKLPGMKETICETIRSIIKDGLDKNELAASLDHLEFVRRERREPYGVHLAIAALDSWLYGGEPTTHLEFSEHFAFLREKLGTSYFEDLLAEIFLPDEGLVVLNVLPSETLAKEREEEQKSRLEKVFGSMSAEERAEVAKKTEALNVWHQTPDTEEALATIPHLSVKDIPTKPLLTKVTEKTVDGVRVLRPEIESGKTVYIDLYFPIPGASAETLSSAALLSSVLKELPTGKHTAAELQKAIKSELGEMSFGVEAYGEKGRSDRCTPYFRASVSVLSSKVDKAAELLGEVLTSSDFAHPEKIEERAKQVCLARQQDIVASGHAYAMRHALAAQTAEGYALEHIGGYSYYDRIRGICASPADEVPAVIREFEKIRSAFTTGTLTVSVVGEVSDEQIRALCARFPRGDGARAPLTVGELTKTNDAVIIPAGIAYAVKAVDLHRVYDVCNVCDVCDRLPGSMSLMRKLLSLDYLWNEVRVKGGAYGAGMNITPGGSLFSYSYRDPDPARTLEVYSRAAEHLKARCAEGYPLEQLIIGAVSDSEPLRSAHEESKAVAARVLRGITEEEKETERRELLGTSHEDLLECCRILTEAEKYCTVCVVGGQTLTDACAVQFDRKLTV